MWIYTFSLLPLQAYRARCFDFHSSSNLTVLSKITGVWKCCQCLFSYSLRRFCFRLVSTSQAEPLFIFTAALRLPQEKSRVTQSNLPLLRANTTFHPMHCTHKKDSIPLLSFKNMLRLLSALTLTVENYSSWIKYTYVKFGQKIVNPRDVIPPFPLSYTIVIEETFEWLTADAEVAFLMDIFFNQLDACWLISFAKRHLATYLIEHYCNWLQKQPA